MTKQLSLDGKMVYNESNTCEECINLYFRTLSHNNRVRKCDKKPRGFCYDLKKNHPACKNFKSKVVSTDARDKDVKNGIDFE